MNLGQIRHQYHQRLAQFIKSSHQLLLHHPLAQATREYLASRIAQDQWERWSFGYFPPNMATLNFNLTELQTLGLSYIKQQWIDNLPNVDTIGTLSQHSLIFPYQDLYGNFVGVMGRTIENNLPKYKYVRGPINPILHFKKSLHLFGLHQALPAIEQLNQVIIVEAQLDCILAHQMGLTTAVALGGCSLSKFQLSLLLRYTDHMFLLLDNDKEGLRGQNKIINRFAKEIKISTITFSQGKDLGESVKILGQERVLEEMHEKML